MLEQKILQDWLKLIFEMFGSGFVTFLIVFGGVLSGSTAVKLVFHVDPFPGVPAGNWALAVGLGSISAGVLMIAVFRRSPRSKGMIMLLPSWEATAEINTDTETIAKK